MSEQEALDEIRQQLQTRGDGKVWIDDWRERFRHVANTPKDLMLRHGDKFSLSFEGNRYTVALVEGASWDLGDQGKASGKGGGWVVPKRYPAGRPAINATPTVVKPRVVPALPSTAPTPPLGLSICGGGGKGFSAGKAGSMGKGSKGGKGAPLALPMWPQQKPGTEEEAVAEIRKQLTENNGYVWIRDWRQRFGAFAATQKEFLENRPEYFFLTWEGRRYTVEYIGPEEIGDAAAAEDAAADPTDAAAEDAAAEDAVAAEDVAEEDGGEAPALTGLKRPLESTAGGWQAKVAKTIQEAEQGTEEDAVNECVSQLRNPRNKEGKVWFNNWKVKYGHLGLTPRELLEIHPERFEIVPGAGTRFTVRLVELDEEV